MSQYAIQVERLGKEYIIGGAEQRHESFREMLSGALAAPLRKLRKLGGTASEEERFWALKNLSFEVKRGEVLGVIGRNGAGKSTLLKVLSRITSPTEGRVVTQGRVASLLEVGTGFHPELTGRENIFLNGAILGMARSDIQRRFDEIVAFAEIERFLDTPVKRYSSGMYVRLAFSVAAHMEPDILLVDEVLAVGDAEFQKRCLGKMDQVAEKGRTVLFVSHNMGMISKLCSRGIVLSDGVIDFDGKISEAIGRYFASAATSNSGLEKQLIGNLRTLIFDKASINGLEQGGQPAIQPSEEIAISVDGRALVDLDSCKVTLYDCIEPTSIKRGKFRSIFRLPAFFLSPGMYTVSIGGFTVEGREWRWATDVTTFAVTNEWYPEYDTTQNMGLVNLCEAGTRESPLHHGPGETTDILSR